MNRQQEVEEWIQCQEPGCRSWYHIRCVFSLGLKNMDEINAEPPFSCEKHK